MALDRELADAFDALHTRSAERTWIYGRLGYNSIIDVQSQPGAVYVSLGIDGDHGLAIAQDRIGIDKSEYFQRVKMKRENGQLLIREAEVLATGGSSGVTSLSALLDVDLSSLTSGDALIWNSLDGKWENETNSSVAAHALNGGFHTGTLDDAQAPQFLKYDGSRALTGNLAVVPGVTIDGVNISAFHDAYVLHIADPDAHHNHATVGNGLSISAGQLINLNLDTNPGLEFNALNAQKFRVKIDTTMVRGSSGVGVDTNHNFTWTGIHQFNVTPQINANLNFMGGDRSITSNTGDDVMFDLGGDLLLEETKRFATLDYQDAIPIAGFSIFVNTGGDRQLTINTIKSDSLHTRVFVADGVRIDIGEEYWGKSMGILYADFISPASNGATTFIYLEDSPVFNSGAVVPPVGGTAPLGGALFASGDWVLFRYIDWGTGLDYGSVWGQVSGYVALGPDLAGKTYQRWTFTMRHGDYGVLVKKGNVGVDFGVSGQGYAHLSTLQDADGPWFRIGTWTGSDPFTPGNNHIKSQMGYLGGLVDPALNPTGYGFYSDNAYLHGVVRTAQTIMDDEGLSFDIQDVDGSLIADTSELSHISWWDDVGDRSGIPKIDIMGWVDSTRLLEIADFNRLMLRVEGAGADAAIIDLEAGGSSTSIRMDSRGTIWLRAASAVQTSSDILPFIDLDANLGSASKRFGTVYADQIIITGGLSAGFVGGSTWSYTGDMIINANGAGTRTVSITNGGIGRANFDVDQDITLGGVVDGVDVGALGSSYFGHITNPNAHHNQQHVLATGTALGPDHTISGAAAGEVLRALTATTAAFDLLNHSDLDPASITPNQHHNQSHVLATGTALGTDHTISGAAAGEVLRALSATTAAFDVLQHSDLGGITANQHHNQAHVLATGTGLGPDHTISGAVAGQVLRALSATTAAFDVLAHTDLDPASITANQHHNQVHNIVGSDHTGTGATQSVIGFTGTNVLGVLVPSSDVGTTPVSALLKSTSFGGLTLGNLTVKGDVNVINNGDFAVGNNVLFVMNNGDPTLDRVGINRAPDPQFALDVNGPIRGTELIGRHAIQLQDVALLLHFDGGEPYESNYTGEPNAIPNGRVPLVNTAVHYRPGKFYKGAVIGPIGTNLITNPSFEVSLAGWTTFVAAPGDAVVSVDSTESWYGSHCARMDYTSSNGTNGSFYIPAVVASSNGGKYSFGVWMRAAIPTNVNLSILRSVSPFTVYDTKSVPVTEDWQYFYVDATPPAGVGLRCAINPGTGSFPSGNSLYMDGAQFEVGDATLTMIGDLGSGYDWTGADNASTSTRANGRLDYTIENMVAHRWSYMGWFYFPSDSMPTNLADVCRLQWAAGYRVAFYFGSASTLSGNIVSELGSTTPGLISTTPSGWYHLAATYDGASVSLYVNGVLEGIRAATFAGLAPDTFRLGVGPSGTAASMIMDDVCVSRQYLSGDRIRAIYESEAPVFAESSVFNFRATPTGLVWADEEGLWMKDILGEAVLGAYGGEAATKSWGGFVMEKGDIAFGRFGASDGGWLFFNRNGVSGLPFLSLGWADKGTFSFDSGGASISGVLDIGTGGGIYQGTGTFAAPSTGLRIANSGGIGIIAGYNASVLQWYANTDGKMYAGAGRVRMDSDGLWLSSTAGEVFGVYTGTSTVSWAGLTLSAGDAVLGDLSRGAYLLWDDSAGDLIAGKVGAGASSLLMNGTDLIFRVNTTERIKLSGAGTLEIKDSGGAAVFTFNASAGAEFTKPLTLGAAGGIYQGTGTFAVPTTGLKIWNSSGVGRIAGYNAGVVQWFGETDGKLYAGAGNVFMDANGLNLRGLNASTLDFTPNTHSVSWTFSGLDMGGISAQRFSGSNYMVLASNAPSGGISSILLQCNPFGTIIGGASLQLFSTGDAGIGGPGTLSLTKTFINQGSTTGASPVLTLNQNDNSEEFIEFDGISGSGTTTPISTAALGAYVGKVRVSLNGVFRWIAIYA
jgi:hypothetical protein